MGDVWTSVLLAETQALDGLAPGPPQTQVKTDPGAPYWSLTLANAPPLGGVTLFFRPISTRRCSRRPEAVMISNPQVVRAIPLSDSRGNHRRTGARGVLAA
jgi:hypothetical protein